MRGSKNGGKREVVREMEDEKIGTEEGKREGEEIE